VLRTSLKAAWAHKRRLLSTAVAVVLGVAFMSGTLLLGDTLDRSFDDFFGEALSETDAVVRGPVLIETGFGSFYAPVDEEIVDVVAGVDGVAAVGAFVDSTGIRVLDKDGEPIGTDNGPPTLIQTWIDDTALSGITLADGRGPEAADELALNVRAADDTGVQVGDQVDVVSAEGTQTFTLVGTFRFAGRDSALGTVTASFVLETAQALADMDGQLTSVSARTDDLTQEELVARIVAALPAGTDLVVLTGQEFSDEISSDVSQALSFFTVLLLVFAFIALIVGAFIIFNTFSILVAQRSKELALLRAIGASRRQVLASVMVEALVVGLVAAVAGIGLGILLGIGVLALLGRIGLDLPATDVAITRGAIIAALVTGVGVTLASALVPARRATRVPPLAALRDVAIDRSGRSMIRVVIGMALLVLAVFAALPAFDADPDTGAIQMVGMAALALLAALVVLGPVIARPLARALGAALPTIRGTTGLLAKENAARSPKRTASTAAALMIGVGLIAFINIFTASARASIDAEVTRGLRAEFIVQPSGFDLGIPLPFAELARAIEGVEVAASVQGWLARVEHPDGSTRDTFVQAIEPADYRRAVEAAMAEGTLDDLVPGTILYDRRIARNNDISIGDEVTLTFTTGQQGTFTVAAIGDDPQLLGGRVITQEDWGAYATNVTDQSIFVLLAPGADPAAVRAELDQLVEAYPTVQVQDQDEFLGDVASQVNAVLNVVYGLLALSIIIALIGIANTLSLSIHERTRELGLLRAVGMTRSQVRSAVRWEAVIISLIGTGLGLAFGLVTSYVLIESLKSQGLTRFELPIGALVGIAVIFAALGVLASLLPSRRAARLDVLDAIATE
jgi:putative ABC transport system permease protein